MYRYLKLKHNLKKTLSIQNLKSHFFSSPPHPYQPSELNLPGNLQELLPELQDIQPCPSKVLDFDEILFDPKVRWINMIFTYKFLTYYRILKSHNCKRAPFLCTEIIFTRTYGHCFIPPVLVDQIDYYSQYLHFNIPSYGVVHNSPPGYMDSDGWIKCIFVCAQFFSLLP